jgi:hypothetical protein
MFVGVFHTEWYICAGDKRMKTFNFYDASFGELGLKYLILYDMIYLLTAIGLSPGGSTHLHTNNTQNNTNNN